MQRAIDTVATSDIVIVPSVLLPPGGWKNGPPSTPSRLAPEDAQPWSLAVCRARARRRLGTTWRFASATGLTPIVYVQRLRIEDAKRRLERTDASVDEISWRVG